MKDAHQGKYALSRPESWVGSYADYLFAFALYRINDTSLAEELVQETFVAALAARSSYQANASEKTWLTGILKHKIMDHLRGKYRRKRELSGEALPCADERPFNTRGGWTDKPLRWRDNPQHLYEKKEFMQALAYCLESISPRHKDAFILREIDGASTEEICKVLNISSTNYWVTAHRARLQVRRCMEIEWFTGAEEQGEA